MESKQNESTSQFQRIMTSIPIQINKIISKSFFRSVKVVGINNIPKDEPVIICANHQNQFMDGINIYGHISKPERPIKFLIAGKSYRRPIIGHMAKWTQTIPVERAQDFAKKGDGKIIAINKDRIRGQGTKFISQLKIGQSITIKEVNGTFLVTEIISDLELLIKETDISFESQSYNYKYMPKLDQSQIYNAVSDCLKNKDIIGIFPEGGSSDRTDLLPLKAGVCIMALEAMIKYNIEVNIICCGFNYFKGHKFRSKVIMEFGIPYKIPFEYAQLYKQSKRDAIAKLLSKVNQDMRSVLYTAPTYQDLTTILKASKIYQPDDRHLNSQDELELNKRFSKGYNQLKENPEIQKLAQEVQIYRQSLKHIGLSDRELMKFKKNFISDFIKFLKSFIVFVFCASFALPGFLLNSPVGFVLTKFSIQEREKCLKESTVKIKGNDVVASYQVKLALVFLPIYHCFFSLMLYFVFSAYFERIDAMIYVTLFFIFYPFYSYTMLKSSDKVVKCFKNMKARVILLFSFHQIKSLREKRRYLKQEITLKVNQYFEEICGQDNKRIVEPEDEHQQQNNQKKIRSDILSYLNTDIDNQQFVQDTFAYLKEIGI